MKTVIEEEGVMGKMKEVDGWMGSELAMIMVRSNCLYRQY